MVDAPQFAVVFPGQGAQSQEMLESLDYPEVHAAFDEASSALDLDLVALAKSDDLHDTQYTQPILLATSVGLWRYLQPRLPTSPAYFAGHSLGEYSALVATNALTLSQGAKLTHARGKLMSQAVAQEETKMAAILGLEDEAVNDLCALASLQTGYVAPVNYNSQGQVVIAGVLKAVDWVLNEVAQMGKKSVPLKVSVPSHCALMKSATKPLHALLEAQDWQLPKVPVVQNRIGAPVSGLSNIKTTLAQQLESPVLWTQSMEFLAQKRMDFIIECGPGNILTNLAKRQKTPLRAYATDKNARIQKLLEEVL